MIDTRRIMRYEAGQMTAEEQIDFFAELIRTNQIHHLQGSYGRMGHELQINGYIDEQGNVLRYPESEF